MNEEMMKEFKIFREQIYAEIARLDEILRALTLDKAAEIIANEVTESEVSE
jgi:hypothetical protein